MRQDIVKSLKSRESITQNKLQTELLEFFKTLYVDDALRNDDTININKLRSEVPLS